MVARLARDCGVQTLPLDDFFLPISEWPADISPSFPFPFYRYADFLAAVEDLAKHGWCSYLPFDWDAMRISERHRNLRLEDGPVAVEGTSALHPAVAPLYDLRFFVQSHESSVLKAVLERDGSFFEKEWRALWLPSVAAYMETNPRGRADYLVRGRGLTE